jgi:hypothetical protein
MTAPRTRSRQPRPLDAGSLQPEISSFRLHLAAGGKAAKTITTYTQAAQWFAAGFLLPETGRTRWEEVGRQDVQQWIALLLGRYSAAYASNQYRALQQFFKWLAAEDDIGDPMPRMKPRTCPTSRSRSSPATNCPTGARLRRPLLRPAPRRRDHRLLQAGAMAIWDLALRPTGRLLFWLVRRRCRL